MKKKFLLLVFAVMAVSALNAETKWYNPMEAGYPVVQNQGWTEELSSTYQRLPDRAKEQVREPLWNLSLNSSGLAIYFTTDAPSITVKYAVTGPLSMPHMPSTGVTGVDLYKIAPDGKTHEYCFSGYSFGDTVRYSYNNLLPTDYDGKAPEYRLNLPLYNTVTNLEIGIPDSCSINFLPKRQDKPIVVYGTSIAHGACSSRPGMAWVNIVRRNLNDYPLVNLGFSGNGRLEPELISLINELDAAVYVLDCMPNLTGRSSEQVYNLVMSAVGDIRAKSGTPIILIEHAGYSNAVSNPKQFEEFMRANMGQRRAFDELQAKGTPNLYYITREELGYPADAWVDYVHPSDLGAQKQADVVTERLKAVVPGVKSYCE